MADKEIKVHRRVIRMIFPMIQRAKNDRSVRRALPVYDSEEIHVNACVTVKHLARFLQCNGGKLEESDGFKCFSSFLVC